MRISDWSSDVCSSDLRAQGIGKQHLDVRGDACEISRQPCQGAAAADADHDRIEHVVHLCPDLRTGADLMRKRIGRIGKLVDVKAAGDLAAQTFGDLQLGRTACRERVCQYWKILVVAVTLK